MKTFIRFFVDVRDEEVGALFWGTLYGFFILFSYYILRAVRDDISSAERGSLHLLWTAVFFVMLGAVPLYSWLSSRFRRSIFVPLTNRFFLVCLVGFYVSLQLLPPDARPWIDRVFYVFSSVYALFVVTVYWGFVNDCFSNDQGRRLFSFIAVGSSIGAILGSTVTARLAEQVPSTFVLLLVACVPLECASWCVKPLGRWFNGQSVTEPSSDESDPSRDAEKPLTGNALSGIKVVFQSPYLLGIAGFIGLMTFSSTILYYEQAHIVGEAFSNRPERTAFYARIDQVTNVLTILFQVYLTARFIRWIGVGISLAMIPALTFLGLGTLGLWPTLSVLVVTQVLYRAGRYGVTRPAREILFTVVDREQKYKSKAFLDAAVYRGGDLISGWIFAGLQALGLSLGAIALTSAPVAGIWATIGWVLGKRQDTLKETA
jgi:AAA family ATP:ADP antiporter